MYRCMRIMSGTHVQCNTIVQPKGSSKIDLTGAIVETRNYATVENIHVFSDKRALQNISTLYGKRN